MDFDYEGSEDFGGRILWPRIAVFGVALLLAFVLGNCTGGGGDVSQSEFDEVVASNSEAQAALVERDSSIAQLQQELIEARATGPTTGTPGTGGTTGTPGTDATDGADATPGTGDTAGTTTGPDGARTYEVQAGDTLSTIAQAVYGDPTAFGIIATANNLSGDSPLQVGQVLTIPDNPDQ